MSRTAQEHAAWELDQSLHGSSCGIQGSHSLGRGEARTMHLRADAQQERAEAAERERDAAREDTNEQRIMREHADVEADTARERAQAAERLAEQRGEALRLAREALGQIVAVGGAGGSPPERLPRLVKIQGIARGALARLSAGKETGDE